MDNAEKKFDFADEAHLMGKMGSELRTTGQKGMRITEMSAASSSVAGKIGTRVYKFGANAGISEGAQN